MKKLSLSLFVVITLIIFNSCSKEETKSNEPLTSAFTVYKNQSGDVSADALQAQNTDSKGVLNFYGAFDSENNPREIRTLTYQKANNDTIVNLIMDPLTNRLASSYFSVKGVKSPVVLKFDYIEGVSNAYNLSYYNYNWENETSELLYAARVETNNEVASSNPFFANRGGVNDGFYLILQSCTIGFVTVKIIVPALSGLITASATVLAAAVAAPLVTMAAVGAVLYFLTPQAGAAELNYSPSSSPPPSKTPIINPVSATSNPTPKLQTSSCVNTNMTFRASMDFEGSILISEVAEGQSPYTYMVSSGFQQSQVFSNKYKDGSYVVGIKDANGCVSVKLVSLKREIDCSNTSLKSTVEVNSNNASATVSGGIAPYKYLWSNGAVSQSVSNLFEGNYELKVTDAVGCEKVNNFSIVIDCALSTLAVTTSTTGNSATAIATGGQAPYTYKWSNGSESATATNLTWGAIYTVSVVDAQGCNTTLNATIVCDDATIKFGTLCWGKTNLDVSNYRNGDPIPEVTDEKAWATLTTGAWCYFKNDPNNGAKYGKLYNKYAVNDPRGLAPVGYHIANSNDAFDLRVQVGSENGGGKLKSTTDWKSPNTGATNSSGFTALPGGFRYSGGQFSVSGESGDWWGGLSLTYNSGNNSNGVESNMALGKSVRCVKD